MLKPQRILIVDDDLSICDVLQELLIPMGYDVIVSEGTKDIESLVAEENPDLIVLDYLLPFINGGDLCNQLKKNKKYAKIPVIIYSAYPKVMMSLGDYSFDAFIAKPFDLNEMVRNVEILLAKK